MQLKELKSMTAKSNQYIGVSADIPNGIADLPTEGVTNGSTFFVADTSTTYIFCKTNWYEI